MTGKEKKRIPRKNRFRMKLLSALLVASMLAGMVDTSVLAAEGDVVADITTEATSEQQPAEGGADTQSTETVNAVEQSPVAVGGTEGTADVSAVTPETNVPTVETTATVPEGTANVQVDAQDMNKKPVENTGNTPNSTGSVNGQAAQETSKADGEEPAEPNAPIVEKETMPQEVQKFLDAAENLQKIKSVTKENAKEIGEKVMKALDMYKAMSEENQAREDVQKALKTVQAFKQAAEEAEQSKTPETEDTVKPAKTTEAAEAKQSNEAKESDKANGSGEAKKFDAEQNVAEPSYATVAELEAAFGAALEAMEASAESGDTKGAVAAMNAYLAVYNRLSPEDQAANAEAMAYVQGYRDQISAGNPDEGIDTLGNTSSNQTVYFKTVKVYNVNTYEEFTFDVGTAFPVRASGESYNSVGWTVPYLSAFLAKSSQYSGYTYTIAQSWNSPNLYGVVSSGFTSQTGGGKSHQEGQSVEVVMNNSQNKTITYYVTEFKAGSTGTGGDKNEEYTYGTGRHTKYATVVYHSNYPDKTDYKVTQKITLKMLTPNGPWNVLNFPYKSYSDCGFGGYTQKVNGGKTWYTSAECTTKQGSTLVVETDKAIIHLYAGWETAESEKKQPVTLTYMDGDAQYGSIETYPSGTEVLVRDCSNSHDGALFLGWDINPAATNAVYEANETFTLTKNTTLYAVWKQTGPTDNGNGISITKTRVFINDDDSKTTAEPGDTITWNITVTNNSNVTKTVTLTEQLMGASLSKNEVTLEAGKSETVTATYTVKRSDKGKTIVNTVKGSTGETGEDKTASDPGTEIPGDDPGTTRGNFTVTKSFVGLDAGVDGPSVTLMYNAYRTKDGSTVGTPETGTVTLTKQSNGTYTGTITPTIWNLSSNDSRRTTHRNVVEISENLSTAAVENYTHTGFGALDAADASKVGNDTVKFDLQGDTFQKSLSVKNTYIKNASKQITVTWMDGYTTTPVKTESIDEGSDYSELYPDDLTREGYAFDGWGDPVTDGDGNITIIATWARFTIVKNADKNSYAAGEDLTWTVEVSHNGKSTIKNLNLTDTLKGVTLTAKEPGTNNPSNFSLAKGETATFTATLPSAAAGSYKNTVELTQNTNPLGEAKAAVVTVEDVPTSKTITIEKVFTGIEANQIPNNFALSYSVNGAASVTLDNTKASKSGLTWTWSDVNIPANATKIVFTESNAEIDNKTLTAAAAYNKDDLAVSMGSAVSGGRSAVNSNEANTDATVVIPAGAARVTITNAYADTTVTPERKITIEYKDENGNLIPDLTVTKDKKEDGTDAPYKDGDPYKPNSWVKVGDSVDTNGHHYIVETVEDPNKGTIDGDVTITVLLTLDDIIDPENDKNGDEKGDGIPDKYQAIVNYVAGANGTVSGTTGRVITLKDDSDNDKYVTSKSMVVGTNGVTATPNENYRLEGWTPNPAVETLIEGGKTYTYTANFARETPVNPTPEDPTPTPVDPTPTPVDPTPTPVDPTPTIPTPTIPTPTPTIPTPTPTIVIPTPVTTNPTPVQPTIITPEAADATPEAEINEPNLPLAQPEPEAEPEAEPEPEPESELVEMGEMEMPMAERNGAKWALINFALMNLAIFESVMLLIGYFVKTKGEEEEEEEEKKRKLKKKGLFRLLSIPVAVISLIAFILTEDITLPTGFVDKYTILMLLIAIVQTVAVALSKKKYEDEDEAQKETA